MKGEKFEKRRKLKSTFLTWVEYKGVGWCVCVYVCVWVGCGRGRIWAPARFYKKKE